MDARRNFGIEKVVGDDIAAGGAYRRRQKVMQPSRRRDDAAPRDVAVDRLAVSSGDLA